MATKQNCVKSLGAFCVDAVSTSRFVVSNQSRNTCFVAIGVTLIGWNVRESERSALRQTTLRSSTAHCPDPQGWLSRLTFSSPHSTSFASTTRWRIMKRNTASHSGRYTLPTHLSDRGSCLCLPSFAIVSTNLHSRATSTARCTPSDHGQSRGRIQYRMSLEESRRRNHPVSSYPASRSTKKLWVSSTALQASCSRTCTSCVIGRKRLETAANGL
jgi:hypothetical protein